MKSKNLSTISFKVILVGDSGVGKTSLANRRAYQQFSNQIQPTVGVGIFKVYEEINDFKVELNIWDTAGQDKFKSVIPMYVRDAAVCVLVSSIDNQESIQHLDTWKEMIEKHSHVPVYIAAFNKTDLSGNESYMSIDDIRESYIEKYPNLFFVSAKSNDGVQELFSSIANHCLHNLENQNVGNINLNTHNSNNNSYCC